VSTRAVYRWIESGAIHFTEPALGALLVRCFKGRGRQIDLAANVDPSHFFWMQMDPQAVVARLARVGYAHLKDVVFDHRSLALNGLLDHRWPGDPNEAAWRFATVGRGRDASWWRTFFDALAARGVKTAAIEHEDPLVPVEEGIVEAAGVFAAATEAAA